MEITIAEQGAFCLEPAISGAEARGRATAHKSTPFGALSRLLSRPKDEDITVEDLGLRYEPLWYAKAHVVFVFDRRESYKIPLKTAHLKSVNIGRSEYAVDDSSPHTLVLPVVEHCERDERKKFGSTRFRISPSTRGHTSRHAPSKSIRIRLLPKMPRLSSLPFARPR